LLLAEFSSLETPKGLLKCDDDPELFSGRGTLVTQKAVEKLSA